MGERWRHGSYIRLLMSVSGEGLIGVLFWVLGNTAFVSRLIIYQRGHRNNKGSWR